jgi:hypothetical protein
MPEEHIPQVVGTGFETLKKVNQYHKEYWSARDLQPLLGYNHWRSFEKAIEKAVTSCEQSGNDPAYHFARARKPITGGKGAVQEVPDYHLSRFACYLIAQNGDPRKPEIATAQKYFAIQTRRQELSDQLTADMERLELRKQTSEEFKALSGAARQAAKKFGKQSNGLAARCPRICLPPNTSSKWKNASSRRRRSWNLPARTPMGLSVKRPEVCRKRTAAMSKTCPNRLQLLNGKGRHPKDCIPQCGVLY